MNEREKIAAKIKALLSKTTENGCTENEAMIAAQKAHKLMQEYQITLNETEILSEGFTMEALTWESRKRFLARSFLYPAIGFFCDVKIWEKPQKGKKEATDLQFFGLKGDVVFARFLLDSLTAFILRQVDSYHEKRIASASKELGVSLVMAKRLLEGPQHEAMLGQFLCGVARRISERLKAEKKDAATQCKGTGKDLITLDKAKLINAELKQRGIHLHAIGRALSGTDASAYVAGKTAGDSASFNKPINNGQGVKMLPNGRNGY